MRCLAVVGVAFALCALPALAAAASLEGTNGRDTLRGTPQADLLVARGGDDVLSGGRGDDRLHGGSGADIALGGSDQDALFGGIGRDRLTGDAGHDVIRGGAGDDVAAGGVGADRLEGGSGDDRLAGGPGPDTLVGGDGDDHLEGGAGGDRITCGDGDHDVVNANDDDIVADDCETVSRPSDDDDRSWWETALTAGFVVVVVAALIAAAWLAQRILRRYRRIGVPPKDDDPVPLDDWLPEVLVFPATGIVGIVTYTLYLGDASALAVSLLVAGGVFLTGSLFGFLFGVPKSLTGESSQAGARLYKVNTNLEEISDWLTKIIVGLTLIQLGTLIDRMGEFADFLAPALGGEESTEGYVIAILVLFGISGFLIAYIATRLYAERGFARGLAPVQNALDVIVTGVVTGETQRKRQRVVTETRASAETGS